MREPPATGYWRLQECAERLRNGRCTCHRGVNLWITPDSYLEVRVHPDWRAERNSEEQSMDDLSFARSVLQELTANSAELRELIQPRPRHFIRVNEHGTGATCIHYLADGRRTWSVTAF